MPTLLPSGNPTLSPKAFDEHAIAATLATNDQAEIDFLDQARLLNATANSELQLLGQPLGNAANEWAATGAKAREMLDEFKHGWLWLWLTRAPDRIANGSNDQPDHPKPL